MNSSFISRRSPVLSQHGCVSTSQPIASQIGIDILRNGGNAADAAVSIAACLNVTEPCSTGIGGDCFCLYYDASTRTVKGLNGSGKSPAKLSLDVLHDLGYTQDDPVPTCSALNVTVPGAAAAWVDTVQRFGSNKLSLRQLLQPAIYLAEQGVAIHPVAAHCWKNGEVLLQSPANKHGRHLLMPNGNAPRAGDIMKMPLLANTFKELGNCGWEGFYTGRVARAVVDLVQEHGGVLTLEDMAAHRSTFDQPICVNYKGVNVWEMPPNGQGIAALLALNILEGFDLQGMGHNSVEYLHVLFESLRLGFADSLRYVADPNHGELASHTQLSQLLSKAYANSRRDLITDKAMEVCGAGRLTGSDTVYFSVVDRQGNACSFINSNYTGFGTGLVPQGVGFTLHNRGAGFNMEPSHPNVVGPSKRPYNTIIPAMLTSQAGDLMAAFGVMGGFMQPQGHVQVLLNMLEFGMNPQEALDQPRMRIGSSYSLAGPASFEDGIAPGVIKGLKAKGHDVNETPMRGCERFGFGRGQVITRGNWWSTDPDHKMDEGVLWAASDSRADGLALGLTLPSPEKIN